MNGRAAVRSPAGLVGGVGALAAGFALARAVTALRAAPSASPPARAAEEPGASSAPAPLRPLDVGAPVWEPAVLSALATWEPAAPRSAVLRAAAVLWAAPMSLAGLLAGVGSLGRPTRRDGVLLFTGATGITGFVLRRRGFAAAALGHVVIARGTPSPDLFAHELVHVRQAERLGPLMAPVYLGLLVPYGYARHPLERAARRAGQRVHSGGS